MFGVHQIIVNVGEKVRIFKIRQHQKIEQHTDRQKQLFLRFRVGIVDTFSQNEVGKRGKQENKDKQSARFEVKKQTYGK
jgi:hypothetical protein